MNVAILTSIMQIFVNTILELLFYTTCMIRYVCQGVNIYPHVQLQKCIITKTLSGVVQSRGHMWPVMNTIEVTKETEEVVVVNFVDTSGDDSLYRMEEK